jgi:CheY-like chemotaxis protein
MSSAPRVLIIEDETHIREIARISLELVGWEVLTASSGAEGLALAESAQPDLIVLDVKMPGLDGPATFAALQANPLTSSIAVVWLTASVQGSERRRLEILGGAGILPKPFDPLKLPAQLARLLGWELTPQPRRELATLVG